MKLQSSSRIGRNEKCFCGSGKKFKQCCFRRESFGPKNPGGDDSSTVQTEQNRTGPVRRIPVHYSYPEPFGVAECTYMFPIDRPIILNDGQVIPAEWLSAGMQFLMENTTVGTITEVGPPETWDPPSPERDTHGNYLRRVLGTIKHRGYVVIDVSFGGQTVTSTPDHLWYSRTRSAWVPIGNFQPGELLMDKYGNGVPIDSIGPPRQQSVELYNFEVEECHTFFVGGVNGALVHNGVGNYIQKPMLPAAFSPSMQKSLARHAAWGGDVGSISSTINRLGKRALREANGDWRKSQVLFDRYLQRATNRLGRVGSKYGIEIEAAAIASGKRVPAFLYNKKTSAVYAFPGSRRLDAGLFDATSAANSRGQRAIVAGFDITLDASKPNIVKYYQHHFGNIPIFDIRLD